MLQIVTLLKLYNATCPLKACVVRVFSESTWLNKICAKYFWLFNPEVLNEYMCDFAHVLGVCKHICVLKTWSYGLQPKTVVILLGLETQCFKPISSSMGFKMPIFYFGRFFLDIASDSPPSDSVNHSLSFISDGNVLALHRLLWNNQERIGQYLSSNR